MCDEDDGHEIGPDMVTASGGGKPASRVKAVIAAASEAAASVQSLILKQQTEVNS